MDTISTTMPKEIEQPKWPKWRFINHWKRMRFETIGHWVGGFYLLNMYWGSHFIGFGICNFSIEYRLKDLS